jgi:hypothetical protein
MRTIHIVEERVPGIHAAAIAPDDVTALHLLESAEQDGRSYRYFLVRRSLQPSGGPTSPERG